MGCEREHKCMRGGLSILLQRKREHELADSMQQRDERLFALRMQRASELCNALATQSLQVAGSPVTRVAAQIQKTSIYCLYSAMSSFSFNALFLFWRYLFFLGILILQLLQRGTKFFYYLKLFSPIFSSRTLIAIIVELFAYNLWKFWVKNVFNRKKLNTTRFIDKLQKNGFKNTISFYLLTEISINVWSLVIYWFERIMLKVLSFAKNYLKI